MKNISTQSFMHTHFNANCQAKKFLWKKNIANIKLQSFLREKNIDPGWGNNNFKNLEPPL